MHEAPTKPTTPDINVPENDPAEGAPDMNLPGADRPTPAPDREDELPQRLGERIGSVPGEGIAAGEPDLFPNVEVPEAQM